MVKDPARRCRGCARRRCEPRVEKIALEKEMATHSFPFLPGILASVLAWGIPWTQEPGGLQSMGLYSVRRD